MAKLSDEEISLALKSLPGWEVEGAEIVKEFRFADFMGSVGFVNRLAERAEAADHHPDLDIRWNKVRVALSTHSAGGLTARDPALAAEIEAAATTTG